METKDRNYEMLKLIKLPFTIEKGQPNITAFRDFKHPGGPGSDGDDGMDLFMLLFLAMDGIVRDIESMLKRIESLDGARDSICYILMNRHNSEFLTEEHPFRDVLDMRLFYFMVFGRNVGGIKAALITKSLMERWQLTENGLYEIAAKNTPIILPPKTEETLIDTTVECDEVVTASCSNIYENQGAAAMLYDGVISDFASDNLGKNIYVIPASIHNVVLIATNTMTTEDLYNTLKSINAKNTVESYLSDNVYQYNRTADVLTEIREA